jgi:hypothetical protein
LEPLIKKNQIRKNYYHWLSENIDRHLPKKVLTIEFVGFYYKQERFLKGMPKPFYLNGEAYVAEVWNCKDLVSGKPLVCKFRHPVANQEITTNSSLTARTNIIDNSKEANLLMDSIEEFYQGYVNKRTYPNKLLRQQNQKHLLRIEKIKELIKEEELTIAQKTGLFLMLRHKETPIGKTFSSLQKFRKENPLVYDQLIAKINYENITNDTLSDNIECRSATDFRDTIYSEMGDIEHSV